MAGWLSKFTTRVAGPVLANDDVLLRLPDMADHAAYARVREESRAFLTPWEPVWPLDDLTVAAFKRRVERARTDMVRDQAYHFLIFAKQTDMLVGGINLVNLRRGAADMASLGYWMSAQEAGKGTMGQALRLVLDHAFGALALHRIEAACLPENERSQRLLLSAGFQQEGLARSYLEIAGVRRDHLLFAVLSGDADPNADITRKLPQNWRI